MTADGRRELLVADPDISCNQAVPLAARSRPIARSAATDTGRTNAVCYLQDIYVGPGLAGVARGTIQKLRVVALEYRAAGIGWNYNGGTAVAAGSRSGEGDAEIAFTLRDKPVTEELAKRHWTASYLALVHASERWLEGTRYLAGTPNALVNWISAQSDPALLPPYAAGSARSGLLAMLAAGHHDVRLGSDETEKLAGWIDLLVPFCGDYREAHAWTLEEEEKYRHFLEKRRGMLAKTTVAD
jgi:hypothetical protein